MNLYTYVMGKKKVLLIMRRRMFSDALIRHSKTSANFDIAAIQDYEGAAGVAKDQGSSVVVVEIPESSGGETAERCLQICETIRVDQPSSKQILLCSELDEPACQLAIKAKRENRIDDFLYFDVSIDYLLSKLESLIQ